MKRGTKIARETTDFVADEETAENRIIPDGGFVLENIESGRRGLFFVEMDMATERIVTFDHARHPRHPAPQDLAVRSLSPERSLCPHLWGMGRLPFFHLAVRHVRGETGNVRREMSDLPADLAPYFRFSTFERANADFLGAVWKTRSMTDNAFHALVREQPQQQPAMAN